MTQMFRILTARLLRHESGATAVEYALLVAFIATIIIGTVLIFGEDVRDAFATVDGSF